MMLSPETQAIMPKCIAVRRHLHAHPELSFEETETTAYLIAELKAIPGLTLQTPTKTGVVATLRGAYPGRCIAIRADIDALPIQEKTDIPFASQNPSVMHACGHDGHAAMLLSVAHLLSAKQKELHGEVRFIFQHAEEVPPGGAEQMRQMGVGEGVSEFYGIHLTSNFPTGTFGVRSGALTSATDRFDITVRGKGGHSAFPETCIDPMVIAAQIILSLQTIVARRIKAVEPAVVSVCMAQAGQAYNIIPNEAELIGSTRTFDPSTRAALPVMMEQIIKGCCDAAGAAYDFSFSLGYPSVMNDPALTAAAREVIESAFGKAAVLDIDPVMPGEDFAAFLQNAPGFFVELGARNEQTGCDMPHHNPLYKMDENALQYGVEYLYRLALSRLQ